VFPSIIGNPRVALLQPPEEPVRPDELTRLEKKKKKKEIIDLTETAKVRRKREQKAASNKKQSEKRRVLRKAERERNKYLSPGEKEKLARGVIEAEKGWVLMDLYDKENNNINWSDWKRRKRDWEEGDPEEDFWELNKLPDILEKMIKDKDAERDVQN
jgi:hypothetical protein